MAETLIVIPCYNEANRLRLDAFGEQLAADSKIDFLFVDDGSEDNTLEVLQHLAELEAQSREQSGPQLGLFEPAPAEKTQVEPDPIHEALAELDCDELTPREALEMLYRFKRLAAQHDKR